MQAAPPCPAAHMGTVTRLVKGRVRIKAAWWGNLCALTHISTLTHGLNTWPQMRKAPDSYAQHTCAIRSTRGPGSGGGIGRAWCAAGHRVGGCSRGRPRALRADVALAVEAKPCLACQNCEDGRWNVHLAHPSCAQTVCRHGVVDSLKQPRIIAFALSQHLTHRSWFRAAQPQPRKQCSLCPKCSWCTRSGRACTQACSRRFRPGRSRLRALHVHKGCRQLCVMRAVALAGAYMPVQAVGGARSFSFARTAAAVEQQARRGAGVAGGGRRAGAAVGASTRAADGARLEGTRGASCH